MDRYAVLDIETQRIAHDVPGGWNRIQDFGLAIAVAYNVKELDTYYSYYSDLQALQLTPEIPNPIERFILYPPKFLFNELYQTNTIVTFNGIRFDYEVLRPYGLKPELLYSKSFDILVEIQRVLGHRVSLNSVAKATLGEEKSGDGSIAVKWYKEGKIDQVIKYCQKDVNITRRIYEFIRAHGYVQYMSLSREVRTCQIKSPNDKLIL